MSLSANFLLQRRSQSPKRKRANKETGPSALHSSRQRQRGVWKMFNSNLFVFLLDNVYAGIAPHPRLGNLWRPDDSWCTTCRDHTSIHFNIGKPEYRTQPDASLIFIFCRLLGSVRHTRRTCLDNKLDVYKTIADHQLEFIKTFDTGNSVESFATTKFVRQNLLSPDPLLLPVVLQNSVAET